MSKLFAAALSCAMFVYGAHCASAQANVTENESTVIYVNGQSGSDSNSGSSSSPFKTIQAAVNKANSYNRSSKGVKVIVANGVYRETVNVSGYSQTSAAMTIQAANTGGAVIAGSDVLTGWNAVSSTIYAHSWTYNFGTCAVPSGWPSTIAPIALRTEMIFVNGVPYTEVMSYSDLRPGTFFVNESSNELYVDSSTNLNSATVETAVRPQTLTVSNRNSVVFRGLVFRHARNCINTSGAVVNGSTNVLFDTVQANWNNWGGLGIFGSTNVTVKNSIGSYNGGVGFQGNEDINALYSYDETDHNNWRGAQAALYDWGMGGTKLMLMRNTTVQDHFSYANQAQGLWFDTDNKNITVNNATLSGNVMGALQIERNEGPLTLENSHLCSSGQGVNLLTSEKVTIKDNTFYDNSGTNKWQAAVFLAGQAGGKTITDWQTHQSYDLRTTGLVMTGNTFESTSTSQNVFGTYLSGSDWSDFTSTLNSTGNKWYNSSTPNAFQVVNGKVVDLTGWRSTAHADYTSVWEKPATSPAGACALPAPSFTDFNVNLDSDLYTMSSNKAVATVRVNSFGYGPVALSVTGLPSGVSASLSNNNMTSGVATLTITASNSAAHNKVPITVWGVSGSRVHSVTFYVQVS